MRNTSNKHRTMLAMLMMACLLMGAFAVTANAEAAPICGEDHEHMADCYAAHTAGEGEEAIPAEAPETIEVLACTVMHDHTAECYDVWRLTCVEDHEHSQTIGDGCYTLETAALPYVFNYNMSEFVPNANYGLHVVTGGQIASIGNWTFKADEEYILRAEFRVMAPIDPDKEYTYKLPKELIGQSSNMLPVAGNPELGMCEIDNDKNELKVVFTQAAAEYVYANGVLNFHYDFKQKLDMSEIGDAASVTVKLLKKEGAYDEVTFNVAREEVPAIERSVTLEREMAKIVRYGDEFTMNATLVGFENTLYKVEWQYLSAEGWTTADGSELTLTVIADKENVNYDWRILVTVEGAASEEAK